MRGVLYLAIGAIVFVAITFFEQWPVLGWLGGAVSIAVWIALTRGFLRDRPPDVITGGIGLAWSGAIGAFTGLVGALTAWLAQTGNLLGFATPPGDRFGALFGFIGASLGIVLWPLVGALVCVVTALMITAKRAG